MVHYRKSSEPITSDKLKSRAVLTVTIVALFLGLLLGLLFASGLWSARSVHADVAPSASHS